MATYTGAITATSTWYAFEFEVVINNTTGSFAVRKNGNSVNDFSATGLNTRPTSTNNYANKITLSNYNASNPYQQIDDFYWQSGAATGVWLGDIRCYTRMPASDQSVTFSKSFTSFVQTPFTSGTTLANSTTFTRYLPFTAAYDGTVSTGSFTMAAGYTGNLKVSVFASNGSAPTTVITSATTINNPATGLNTITFGTPFSISKGIQYWLGFCTDTSSGTFNVPSGTPGFISSTAYASFPVANPGSAGTGSAPVSSWTIAISNSNCLVNEAQQDGLTSYVFDSNPGDADWYGLAGTAGTPASVIATTIRGYMTKGDAGTRVAEIQLQSGATTVATAPSVLTTSGWQWAWRTDVVDPNTGAAWAPSSVNVALIGPVVTA